jgi:acetylornithine deacetylase
VRKDSPLDPIQLTRELVAIYSPTGEEAKAGAFLAELLAKLGYRVIRQPVAGTRFNVYAFREEPAVVFSTHIDTVPPELPVAEDQEYLYGRGTTDAKGIVAVQLAAAERLAAKGERRIGLLFLVGEEYGADGARAANSLEPKGRYLVNGEPTENRLALGTKGFLRVELRARGKAAHSAYPEEGISAIERMLDTLERLRRLPLPVDELLGECTLNIATIEGGVRPNVIPDRCRAELSFRTVRDTAELRSALQSLLAEGVELEVLLEAPPVRLRALPGFETTVVRYGTDLPWLQAWGQKFLIGPGSIRVAHTEHEKILKSDLLAGVDCYQRIATLLLSELDGETRAPQA